MNHGRRKYLRHFVVWLLACLVPLEGMAAGVLTAIGPAHTHKAMAATHRVLDDFRRATPPVGPRATHLATAFGHFHRADTPLRHHHASDDPSVVTVADGVFQQAADADESSISPTLAAFVGVLPSAVAWFTPAPRGHTLATRDAWPALTHDPEPIERPPRAR